MTRYTLPDLAYDYGALEPHVSARIMELHHGTHHKSYVEGANEAIEQLLDLRQKGDFKRIAAVERAMAFNVSGHVLHSIFWRNMSPDGGDKPTGELAEAIERDFGNFESFKKQMIACAGSTMGSGWAALVWDPILRRLGTTLIHDHQSDVTQAGIPLLVLDAWEHAYYLQYQADKARYFEAIWNVWNWGDVARRLVGARRLDLALDDVAEGVIEEPRHPPLTH